VEVIIVSKLMTRRQVLITGVKLASALAPTSLLFGCGQGGAEQAAGSGAAPAAPAPTVEPTAVVDVIETRLRKELLDASRAASAGGQWGALEFNNLIDSLGEDSLKRACKTLSISPADVEEYASTTAMKREIRKTILDASKFLPGGDPENILYHEKVLLPTARNLELDESLIANYDTLSLERAVYNRVFAQNWTYLNENERIYLLDQSGWGLTPSDTLDLAALSGASFITGLTTLVKLNGFSFYTGMSSGLHALATSGGIVLPFVVYMGLSKAVSVATSPAGWILAVLLTGAEMYKWLVRDKQTSEAILLHTVLHLHNYKVSAMQQAEIPFTIQGL
jgi:hypothetical protein